MRNAPFLLKNNKIVPYPFSIDNTLTKLGALSFCALSFLAGFLISYSTIYVFLLLAALFAIVVIFKPEIGLYLMVSLIPVEALTQVTESLTVVRLSGWVLSAGWLLNVALTKKRIVFPREGWYIVAFFTWGFISAFWAVDPSIVLQRFPFFIELIAFYIVFINLVDTKERINYLFWSLLIGSVFGAGLSIKKFAEVTTGHIQNARVVYEGGHLGYFPATLLLIIPFLFLSIIFAKSNRIRFGLLAITGPILMAFFMAMSRKTVLGLIIITMIILIKYRNYLPRMILFIPVAFFLGLYFMPEAFWPRMIEGFTLEDRLTHRLDIWWVGWNIIKDAPFLGVGRGNFPIVYDSYIPGLVGPMGPHNIYIGTLAELGIVGEALLLILIMSHLKSGYKAVRFFEEKKDRLGVLITSSVILPFLGLIVVSMATDIFYHRFFWLSMALVEVVSLIISNSYLCENKVTVNHPKPEVSG